MPQHSAPFRYSGSPHYINDPDAEYQKFHTATGIALKPGCSIDTTYYAEDWHQRPVPTEVVVCDFTEQPSALVHTAPRSRSTRRRFSRPVATTPPLARPSAA